jgi:flagellar biosynthetic protein FliR
VIVAEILKDQNVILFFLLFSRIGGVLAFFPFFNHSSIPVSIKVAFSLYLAILLFPHAYLEVVPSHIGDLTMMVLGEFAFGLIGGLVLDMVFAALAMAGMQIAMIMGFSMATAVDPTTKANTPIISKALTMLALLILLAFDGHHMILLFLSESVGNMAMGVFVPQEFMWEYLSDGFRNMFILGFTLSFPIIAISFLADTIFGMLMKTMPQFNLLVVGFPIKIALSTAVITMVLGSMMMLFKREFIEAFNFLKTLY